MPLMALYRSSDITPEKYAPYEAYVTSQPVPAGALLHTVAYDAEAGACVVDVWESREAFEQFDANVVRPGLAQFGLPYAPPTLLDVLSVATHDGIDAYKTLAVARTPARALEGA